MRPPDPRHPLSRSTTWKTAAVLLLAGMGALWPVGAGADPGDLDPTFSGDGKVVTEFLPSREHTARAVVIQPDGKIVATGFSPEGGPWRSILLRLDATGAPDPGFGTGVVVFGPLWRGEAVAVQPNGKIVVTGNALTGAGFQFALARYLADGSLVGWKPQATKRKAALRGDTTGPTGRQNPAQG